MEEIFRKFQHGTWKRWDRSLKSSEERWKNSSPRKLDGPMSFEERRTCKTPSEIQGTSCAPGRQRQRRRGIHLRWQRQSSWYGWRNTWRSFSLARCSMLPDCFNSRMYWNIWSRFFHDKDQTNGIRWAILWHFLKGFFFFFGHPFAGLPWERKCEEVLTWECLYVH